MINLKQSRSQSKGLEALYTASPTINKYQNNHKQTKPVYLLFMDITSTNQDQNLLTRIGNLLREEYVPGKTQQVPDQIVPLLALLDDMALRSNRVYSIFDFSRFDYLYCSSNLATLAGSDPLDVPVGSGWDEKYFTVIQDRRSIANFLDIRRQLLQRLPKTSYLSLESSVYGGAITNLKGQHLRLHYRSTPLVFDASGNVVLCFDYLEDITSLLSSSSGYWMRFAGQQVFNWRSDNERLIARDIISPREKTLVSLWKAGKSVAKPSHGPIRNRRIPKPSLSF